MPRIQVDGVSLNFTDTGTRGAPVLLVHAFPFSSKMWWPQIEALGGLHRFIAPDLKGFGASDVPDDPAAYSMSSYARELIGFMDALGVDPVVLVGLSMGGYICLELLRLHRQAPKRIAGLVLADTRAEADSPEGVERRRAQQKRALKEGLDGIATEMAQTLLSPVTLEKRPEIVEDVVGMIRATPVAGFVGGQEAMIARPDSTDDLARTDVPSLVLVGEDDQITPPEAARRMHEHLGGSELLVLPGAGHLSNLEEPGDFCDALQTFVGRL